MKKNYLDNPCLNDSIVFNIVTTDDNGLMANPYSVEKITIYYLEKGLNRRSIDKKLYNQEIEGKLKEQQKIVEDNYTYDNVKLLNEIEKELDKTAITLPVYYNQAKIVMHTTGSALWSPTIKTNYLVEAKNSKNEPINGKFVFGWQPKGMREGTYVVRWDWKTTEKAKNKSAEKMFTILPNEEEPSNIRLTSRDKYDMLLMKYIPLMYYRHTKKNDLTPEVIRNLNKCIGQGFLEIEDTASKLYTLLDPNTIKEQFLPLLANFFKLNLRSESTGAWRNQIRHALNLYKQKGTLEGLKGALDKAGINLLKLSNLWQVVSPFTWTDAFAVEQDNTDILGHLTKIPIDEDYEVSIRSHDNYQVLPKDIISLQEMYIPELKMAVVWHGGAKDEPIHLLKGDVFKIRYKYKKTDNSIEKYIQNLPLADQRDEKTFKYPLKNWNVRLIEEDDPVFNLLIQERHPLSNPVTFGKIRTTFMYSEKVFNMDAYNGSLHNSNNPCDLDKDFLDTCSGGQSSKFNVHLEVDEITDEKIREAKGIITDYSPFHAVLHNMVINGKIVDYVLPPEEVIKGEIKKKEAKGDKINTSEAIYCEVRYKDGRRVQGKVV